MTFAPLVLGIVDGANDAVTAVLALLVASMLRVVWNMQQRLSRLEAMDEYRERVLDKDRESDPADDNQGGSE